MGRACWCLIGLLCCCLAVASAQTTRQTLYAQHPAELIKIDGLLSEAAPAMMITSRFSIRQIGDRTFNMKAGPAPGFFVGEDKKKAAVRRTAALDQLVEGGYLLDNELLWGRVILG